MSSVCITYDDANFPLDDFFVQTTVNNTLREILYAWQDNGLAGSHPITTGGFSGSVPGGNPTFSGTQYTYSIGGSGTSFHVTGELYYYFAGVSQPAVPGATDHTLYGRIDSITIGAGTDSGGVTDQAITFDFSCDPIYGALLDGRTNDVHDAIWGLMNGSVTGATDGLLTVSTGGLIDRLEDRDIDVDDVFATIVGAPCGCDSELLLAA
ncbi:heme acquisition protein HasA [Hephaestia caeni]|uniref:Heme acquisition protein HasA n=1 Tax=Hephaestia caeni TaxID=645617 RepID=A0A397PGB2_9SPHN|nr:heme acquisition protein HasA [Hephaestia caeni]RIA46207.1 heme acquisition protein HasA [Hephaestia caeni]